MLILLTVLAPLYAINGLTTRYNFSSITMEDGLLHNFIDDVYKDHQGFLWLSTSNGLSRYDGYEFTHYNAKTSPVALKSNFISQVCEDNFNRLWIVSEGGVDVLDLETRQLIDFGRNNQQISEIFHRPTSGIYKDCKGNIWLSSINDLICVKFAHNGLILVLGLFLGWLLFGNSSNGRGETTEHVHKDANGQIWTCAMHPQIRMDKPGKCPICGMDLILLKADTKDTATIDLNAVQLSEEAVALANIQTTIISRQNPVKDIRLYGTIQADERLSQSQSSHVNGRIEKLLINFTGESVQQGQTIATIYSPDLLNAQQELLEALKMQQPSLIQAAREKLHLWKLDDNQISKIEHSGNVSPLIEIKANTGGIVVNKKSVRGIMSVREMYYLMWQIYQRYGQCLMLTK